MSTYPGFTLPIACLDSILFCVPASSRKDACKHKASERARDSELVVKLVIIYGDNSTKSLAEMRLPVWIKVEIFIIYFYSILIKQKLIHLITYRRR